MVKGSVPAVGAKLCSPSLHKSPASLCGYRVHMHWGFHTSGALLGSPHVKDCNILGSISGTSALWKLAYTHMT